MVFSILDISDGERRDNVSVEVYVRPRDLKNQRLELVTSRTWMSGGVHAKSGTIIT